MTGRRQGALLTRGLQVGPLRLWVQFTQAFQHGRVGCITDTIGRQELEGPSTSRARTAAAVRSEAWGEAAAVSAALLWARVRGPSVVACRWMLAISSPNGSMTAAKQLSRHC